jgi:hypothetical protein
MKTMMGRNRSRGMGLGSLFFIGLLGVALVAFLNAKDIERYLKLRNM